MIKVTIINTDEIETLSAVSLVILQLISPTHTHILRILLPNFSARQSRKHLSSDYEAISH